MRKVLVGGAYCITNASTFFPIYSCPSLARTSGADAAQAPNTAQSARSRHPHLSSSPAVLERNSNIIPVVSCGDDRQLLAWRGCGTMDIGPRG
jgi:hypothetical protein